MKNENRKYQRHAWRFPCSFRISEGVQQGFITDISARGFFIQTRSRSDPGSEITVTIEREDDSPIVVTGTIARDKRAHRSISSVSQPGIGIQIESAPEDYFKIVLELEKQGAGAGAADS